MGGGGGGVFILFKQDLPLLEEPFLLVRLTTFGPNDIKQKANRYIFAHFIDHLGSASEPLHCLRESIYKIINKEGPSCRVVLAGDFNLPDIGFGKMDLAVLKLAQLMATKLTIYSSMYLMTLH